MIALCRSILERAPGEPQILARLSDLLELSRTRVVVVAAGAKAVLDLPKTLEALETLGVPVVGFGTAELPAFWMRGSGLPLEVVCDDAAEVSRRTDLGPAKDMTPRTCLASRRRLGLLKEVCGPQAVNHTHDLRDVHGATAAGARGRPGAPARPDGDRLRTEADLSDSA